MLRHIASKNSDGIHPRDQSRGFLPVIYKKKDFVATPELIQSVLDRGWPLSLQIVQLPGGEALKYLPNQENSFGAFFLSFINSGGESLHQFIAAGEIVFSQCGKSRFAFSVGELWNLTLG